MFLSKKCSSLSPWFWIGIAAVFLVSLCLRFWRLGQFNTLVFDEVYYATFANNYLTRTRFFNAHPPLSQYIIAIALWIGSHIPIGQDTVNSLTGSLRSTWSYRWLSALTGSFIPLVVAGIAYQLSHRRSYALLAAIFAATDGLFLVESRYALNNIYLVILGLLGQWFFLLALEGYGKHRRFWFTLAGISFGASAAIKWNGLWFLLGAYLVWIIAWGLRLVQSLLSSVLNRHHIAEIRFLQPLGQITNPSAPYLPISPYSNTFRDYNPLKNLTQLNLLSILFYLGIIPVLVYSISWIPHLQLNPTPGFWEMQWEILTYHQRIGDGPAVHPYCSRWYTWPLMLRPVAYFYKAVQNSTDPVPIVGPPLPVDSARVIYDVHAMGNPVLWWFSTAVILFFLWILAKSAINWLSSSRKGFSSPLSTNTWIVLYCVTNWLANLLPWVKVTRCTFIYHYMGAAVFAGLALAWLVDCWLRSYRNNLRVLGITAIFLILLAFVFWMPVYLGLPLPFEDYKLRMWFRSWV